MTFNNNPITTIWLDLDDTLIDFQANAHASLAQMYRDEPLLRTLFPDADTWAHIYETHNHRLWDLYSRAEITQPELRIERFRRPLAQAGLPDRQATETAERYDTLYLDILAEQRRMIPGAIELIKTLKSNSDVKLGILSNGFKEVQYRKIDNTGLAPLIDIVVLSDDIGINKPDPRLFDHAMRRAGDLSPSHHLMIGDNPSTDIAGAIGAGWNAIWFHRPDTFTDAAAPAGSIEIGTLDQVIDLLKR